MMVRLMVEVMALSMIRGSVALLAEVSRMRSNTTTDSLTDSPAQPARPPERGENSTGKGEKPRMMIIIVQVGDDGPLPFHSQATPGKA